MTIKASGFVWQGLVVGAGLCMMTSRAISAEVSSEPTEKLQEVVVTAQRRVEKLQEVPVSAQVISSQTLQQQNFNTLEELTETVPAVHINTGLGFNVLFIRGIGSGGDVSFDQSVATFVDDIYHGRARMSAAAFLDLDRIEILKGPQTTFFGNNAIAGALNIVTKKPGNMFDFSARALYGEYGHYALEGAIGGPISDTFGARLAIKRNGVDKGWIHNVNLGQDVPIINNEAARLTLAFNPNEDLDATLKVEGNRNTTSGTTFDQPEQRTFCPPPAPWTPNTGAWFVGGCSQALALNAQVPGTVPIGLDNNQNTGLPGTGHQLSTFEDVLTINFRLWGQTFTSVSGHYNYHYNQAYENGHLPVYVISTNIFPEKYHQFSQELRVASSTDQRIEYMAGAYFQTDRLDSAYEANAPLFNFFTTLGPPFDALAPYLPLALNQGVTQSERVYSVFGSLGWNVTDRLKLSSGLRGSWTHKDVSNAFIDYGTGTQLWGGFVQLPTTPGTCAGTIGWPTGCESIVGLLFGAPGAIPNIGQSNRVWMPSARIQYQLEPEAMVYLSYNRGFKAGGVTDLQPVAKPKNNFYGPEHVNAYELGLKSTWFQDRLLTNVDVFRSDYKDLQVTATTFDPVTRTFPQAVRNAATSRSQGVELETQWLVTKDLRLSANVTYLDAYYVSYPNGPLTNLQSFCASNYVLPYCSRFPQPILPFADNAGRPLLNSPRWSGSVTGSYSISLPREFKFTTELSPYFTSRYDSDPDGIFHAAGNYVRLDGRLVLERGGHWALDLIGKNLTDRIIAPFNNGDFNTNEEPRNVALQVRYRFQ